MSYIFVLNQRNEENENESENENEMKLNGMEWRLNDLTGCQDSSPDQTTPGCCFLGKRPTSFLHFISFNFFNAELHFRPLTILFMLRTDQLVHIKKK
jgi:hypothetical protein